MAANPDDLRVSLGPKELAWARAKAEREGTTIAAVLTEAARAAREADETRARQDEARRVVLAWLLEGQPQLTDDETAAARRALADE